MARTPRLKVYVAAAGFSEAVVAAPSRKAALEAWGARDDYFAHGLARVVEDAETVAAALAQPGVVLKRPVGSASDLLAAAKPPPASRKPPPAAAAPAPAPAPARPRPDRGPLTAAEQALKAEERAHRELLRDQARERESLDARQEAARKALDDTLADRRDAVARARRAYDRSRT